MATLAHCAYCFESLSAALEKRPALSLAQVQSSWKKYHNPNPSASEAPSALPLSDEDDEDDEAIDMSNAPARPAAVSRLMVPTPTGSSGSSSSVSVNSAVSTPASAVSEASSASSVSVLASAGKGGGSSGSRGGFFGLGKKLMGEKHNAKGKAQQPSLPATGIHDAEDEDEDMDEEEDEDEVGSHPLFVTWNTLSRSGGEKRLRGCIGTFEAQELDDGLRSYALTSAFDDTRFAPITARELPTLECGVTLLTNFSPTPDPMDWTIGTHGLRISFTYHGRRYGSTYLPDVAKEQGWSKEETIVSLMRKAGWNGRREEWRGVELQVVRYQGRQVRLGYKEWKEWREWVGGRGV